MTLLSGSTGAGAILPEEYGALVEKPVAALSAAFLVGTEVRTKANEYRIPILSTDVTVGALVEGAEISPSDAVFAELVTKPAKFGGLSIVSREVADDSNPAAADEIGKSIARQIAKAVDNALFNVLASPNPKGLADLVGISTVAAPADYANLDPMLEAISLSEAAGGSVTSWVAAPATALEIAKLKTGTGSNQALLNGDLTAEGRSTVLGRPVYASPHVPVGTVYAISKEDLQIVLREGTRLDVDNSAYFSSDRIGVRGTMRVAFAVPVPATLVRITNAEA